MAARPRAAYLAFMAATSPAHPSSGTAPPGIDLSSMVCRILDDLRRRDRVRAVRTEVAPTPHAAGDALALHLLLAAVLRHAWQGTAGLPAAAIEFGARRQGRSMLFYVRDNGRGIDERAIDFAACRRIVQRHGGELRAESSPGQGATFRFTLPDHTDSPGDPEN